MNLRAEALPYKRLIAQVLLDKNPRIRTVVNKVSSPSPIRHPHCTAAAGPLAYPRPGHPRVDGLKKSRLSACLQLDLIESKFRTFPLEVLAGEDRLDVELKEGPAKFRFNFSEVGARRGDATAAAGVGVCQRVSRW